MFSEIKALITVYGTRKIYTAITGTNFSYGFSTTLNPNDQRLKYTMCCSLLNYIDTFGISQTKVLNAISHHPSMDYLLYTQKVIG